MNEFLKRFAQRPHIDSASQKRRQLFTVRVGVDEERSSHAYADADPDAIPETIMPLQTGSTQFIVDRTAAKEIDINEFLDAIHKTTGIHLGKTSSKDAFCSLPPSQKAKGYGQAHSSSNVSTATILETFRIRKLGFKIVLKQLIDEPLDNKRGRERELEEPYKDKEKERVKRPYKKRANVVESEKPVYETDPGIAELVAILKASAESGTGPALSLKASPYYMNNRKHFTTFITGIFERYARSRAGEVEAEEFDCSDMASASRKPFSLLYHQKIVREYLSIHSPYRGLLLYHGLGSGKTCSSIAIAEGLSSHKRIIVMTPASLQKNYVEEIKKCGNDLYKSDQHWVFHDLSKLPKGKTAAEYEKALLNALGFPDKVATEDNIVRLNGGGIWVAERGKSGNYSTLDESQRAAIDRQIDKMIRNKYKFINYNGVRMPQWRELMRGGNYFDNAVIIVDEAHNLVSRIVNKLKSPRSLSMQMYEALLSANNAKIVLLTGTPIINYPNELGILFNILRGYINTFNFTLNTTATKLKGGVNLTALKKLFDEAGDKVSVHDYMDFKQIQQKPTLVLTRNPFGFVSNRTAEAVNNATVSLSLTHGGNILDADFKTNVTEVLSNAGISVDGNVTVKRFKALPDKMEDFNELFVKGDGSGILNPEMFSRRIIGLTSYFRSAQEKLMPKYDPMKDFVLIEVEMSNHQFISYKEIREKERKQESGTRKKRGMAGAAELYADTSSTYRIFSRACCNFAFPGEIPRPLQVTDMDEDDKVGKKAAAAAAEAAVAMGIPPAAASDDEHTSSPNNKKQHLRRMQMTERGFDAEEEVDDDDDVPERKDNGAGAGAMLSPQDLHTYNERIGDTIRKLSDNAGTFLSLNALQTMYSPKFAELYERINDPGNEGLHLLYSQFRTLEGIGIFKLVMDANGYAEFNIQKDAHTGAWTRVIKPGDEGKLMYALYTGTETQEKKELIRNIFNSSWDNMPPSLGLPLDSERKNKYGEVIKLLMITASGAEGINLRNVRHVHIMEPYWHPVRTEQIIGRANRICSHHDLPRELQTVKVFLYVMKFAAEQLKPASKDSHVTNIIKYDGSITTDQKLLDTSSKKQLINQRLLTVVKASAIDCVTHRSKGGVDVECFRYKTAINPNDYAFVPNIIEEQKDAAAERNVIKDVVGRPIKLEIDGVMDEYILDESSQTLYQRSGATVIRVGKLVQDKFGARIDRS